MHKILWRCSEEGGKTHHCKPLRCRKERRNLNTIPLFSIIAAIVDPSERWFRAGVENHREDPLGGPDAEGRSQESFGGGVRSRKVVPSWKWSAESSWDLWSGATWCRSASGCCGRRCSRSHLGWRTHRHRTTNLKTGEGKTGRGQPAVKRSLIGFSLWIKKSLQTLIDQGSENVIQVDFSPTRTQQEPQSLH